MLALEALGWALADGDRAERLLSLTGLTPERLRHGIEDRAVQAAVLEFLAGHEEGAEDSKVVEDNIILYPSVKGVEFKSIEAAVAAQAEVDLR